MSNMTAAASLKLQIIDPQERDRLVPIILQAHDRAGFQRLPLRAVERGRFVARLDENVSRVYRHICHPRDINDRIANVEQKRLIVGVDGVERIGWRDSGVDLRSEVPDLLA